MTMRKDLPTHDVMCHVCINPNDRVRVPRNEAMMHGTADFGGLWHCLQHRVCPTCPHGSWCDEDCAQGGKA